MKFLKIFFTFLFAFVVAYLVLTNLSLPQFKQSVSIKIFSYSVPDIPVYVYVVGSFFFGLIIGLIIAVYNYLSMQSKCSSYKKRINHLEKEIKILNEEIEKLKAESKEAKEELERDSFAEQKETDIDNGEITDDKSENDNEKDKEFLD